MSSARRGSQPQYLFLSNNSTFLFLFGLILLGMFAMPASAQIALDAKSAAYQTFAANTTISLPLSTHALGSGSTAGNRLLVCGVEMGGSGFVVNTPMATVTFSGVSATAITGSQSPTHAQHSTASIGTELFYLLDSSLPVTGNYTPTITLPTQTVAVTVVAECTSFTGAKQAAPDDVPTTQGYNSGGATSVSVAPGNAGDLVIDAVAGAWSSTGSTKVLNPNSPQIPLYYNPTPISSTNQYMAGGGSYETVANTNTITVGWTSTTAPSRSAESAVAFAPAPPANYTLTTSVSPSGAGTVTVSPNQTTFASGASVTLTATPATGYIFSGWTGDQTSAANPLTFNITGTTNVVANFSVAPT